MKSIQALTFIGHVVLAPIARAARFLSVAQASSLALAFPLALAACSAGEVDSASDAEAEPGSTEQAIQNGNPGSAVPGVVYVYAPTAVSSGSCSGVMLTNMWLLTAKHCVVDNAGNVASKRTVLIQDGAALQNGVASVLPHPIRDVALVALERPWPINGSTTGFQRALTPYAPTQLLLSNVYCAGWGQGTPSGDNSGKLRNFSSVVSGAAPDNSTFFVTKNIATNQVHRKGDSGGGCFENFGALLGIASEVNDDNNPTYATLVSVDVIRSWIRANVPGF